MTVAALRRNRAPATGARNPLCSVCGKMIYGRPRLRRGVALCHTHIECRLTPECAQDILVVWEAFRRFRPARVGQPAWRLRAERMARDLGQPTWVLHRWIRWARALRAMDDVLPPALVERCECGAPALVRGQCVGCLLMDGDGSSAAAVSALRALGDYATTDDLVDELGCSKRDVLRRCAVLAKAGRVRRVEVTEDSVAGAVTAWVLVVPRQVTGA